MTWLVSLSWAAFGMGQDHQSNQVSITFQLHAPELADDTQVFITGGVPTLGNWNPGSVAMQPLGHHRWSFAIRSAAEYPIEYKYTLGSWAREGANADGHPLQNLVVKPATDTVVEDRIDFWTTGDERKIVGQITGEVRYHRQLDFAGLLPRDVIVWLPPDYEESAERYAVLYMHDGQNIVDPATSSFGVDWQVDETLTRLIGQRKVRPMIVVGIYNTRERSSDYLPGAGNEICRVFVSEAETVDRRNLSNRSVA